MARKVALKIVGIASNPGGTLSVVLTNQKAHYEELPALERVLDEEARRGLHTLYPYQGFAQRVIASLQLLRTFLDRAREAGKSVGAFGASKSGNVILQCCRATRADIAQVGEIASEKVGRFTPGTLLPIVAEEEMLESKPSFLLVLPWHLRRVFLAQPRFTGCSLLFPLPQLELVRTGSR